MKDIKVQASASHKAKAKTITGGKYQKSAHAETPRQQSSAMPDMPSMPMENRMHGNRRHGGRTK